MQDTRDPPSTPIDGTDESYHTQPTPDAESVPKPRGTGAETTGSVGPASAGSAVPADPTPAEEEPVEATPAEEESVEETPAEAARPEAVPTEPADAVDRLGPLIELASGSPFVAAIAAIETVIATVLLGVPLSPAPAVVGLVTFAVYTVDHVADAEADARSTPERARIARRYGDQLMVVAALAYGLAVALSTLGGPLALGVALLPGTLWVAYASDWLPNVGRAVRSLAPEGGLAANRRFPRLKEVPVLSSVVVAAGWTLAVTLLPLAFAGSASLGSAALGAAPREPIVAVAMAYFLLRSFVDTELPNVRDVDADAAAGVATLPTVLGVARTRRVLYGVDLATAATLAAATLAGVLAPGIAAALGLGVAASLAVTALAGRVDDGAVLGVAPDCSYLVVAAALVLTAA